MTGVPTTNTTAAGEGIYQGWTDLSQNKVTGQMEGLKADLASLEGKSGDDLTVALTQVNFKMGQYNAMIELTGNIGKSMNDTLKSICQKVQLQGGCVGLAKIKLGR